MTSENARQRRISFQNPLHPAYTVAIVVAVMLCALMLLAQSPGTALAFAAMAGALFMARRWRREINHRET